MPIKCLNILFFSDKGLKKERKEENQWRSCISKWTNLDSRAYVGINSAGAAKGSPGPEEVKLINTLLKEDVQRQWADFDFQKNSPLNLLWNGIWLQRSRETGRGKGCSYHPAAV